MVGDVKYLCSASIHSRHYNPSLICTATHIFNISHKQCNKETQTEASSNGLEEFGVDMDEPDLFNTSSGSEQSEPLLLEDEQEEDDLEIPAFLRRQKN